ncbi:hypothetical protein J3R83DRAFT_12888 [Lanmaoa asiatica]|nr:hypothetical protein J3R83DRAFT_12888 [Lanmaoa asiatica]
MDSGKVPFSYDVYYWIGQKAAKDDTAIAAYKSVELDEHLGKQAVQYREAQGHETDRSLALFPTFMIFRGSKSTQWHHPSSRLAPGVKKSYRTWTTTGNFHKEFRHFNGKGKQTISYELSFDDLEIEQGGIYVYDSTDKIALFCTKASLA